MPYLVALTGPHTGEAFEVKDGRTTVGRGPACQILLERDGAVSRAHAILMCAGGVVRVEDAGSLHGVFVNGRRVDQAIVRHGDSVQFGGSCLRLQPVPAEVGEPLQLKVVLPPYGTMPALPPPPPAGYAPAPPAPAASAGPTPSAPMGSRAGPAWQSAPVAPETRQTAVPAPGPGHSAPWEKENPVSMGVGCVLATVALLFPIPFGIGIGLKYLGKEHPSSQRLGVICLVVSLVSLVVQVAMSVALYHRIMPILRPLLDMYGGIGG